MVAKIQYLFIIFILASCGDLSPVKQEEQIDTQNFLLSRYILDKDAGGLFERNLWYAYYPQSRLLLSTFDIYGIRSKGRFFKVQIIEFYKGKQNTDLGYYTLRVDRGNGLETVEVDAHACGTDRGGSSSDYLSCIRSDKNRFAYLNLADLSVRYLSDEEGIKDLSWHMAFKVDDIRLNSGVHGPSDTQGAILYKDLRYTTGEDQERFSLLFNSIEGDRDLQRFLTPYNLNIDGYYGPDNGGNKRVIYENFWFKDLDGVRSAIPTNWWLIKNDDERSYVKFNVKSILEKRTLESVEREITFQINIQDVGEDRFSLETEEIIINVDSSNSSKRICIDFNNRAKVMSCSQDGWDIRFLGKGDRWSIQTKKGAVGPLKVNDILDISSGV